MANPRILIVEDDDIVAEDLHKLLLHLGYDVIGITSTGEEAVKKAIIGGPDLVLMDISLRGEMDGIETATTLRFQHGIAVVYISSHADNSTLKRASNTEPFGYILMPFEERQLRAAIEMAFYRIEMERRFKENDAWYGTTLRSIGEAVIATNAMGSVKFMNTSAESLTGWKMSEALGEDLIKVFRTTDEINKSIPHNPVAQILKNKITAVLKNHAILVSREGREIPIDESASPIKDEFGNIVGVVLVFQDVTERKRVQEALKTSQEYAQSIVESSMDMVVTVDLDRRIVEFNKAAEAKFGYKKEEVIGKHINILYADPEEGILIHKKVDELGREVVEVRNKRKNGEVFPCLLSSTVLRNSRGEKIGFMGTSRDITEMKRAEEMSKSAQEYAQSIVHSSLDMIIAVDKDRNIIEFNKAAENTFGFQAKEVLSKNFCMLFADPAEGMKAHKTTLEQCCYVHEVLNKRKNGGSFHCLLSASVLRNSKGEMIGVMGISRDITEKKQADQALRESEERYRSLVELLPDPVIVHADGKLVFVNTAAIELFAGNSASQILGRPVLDMVHPDYRAIVKERVQQMTHEGKRVPTIEEKFIRLDGTSFEAEVAAMPFSWQSKPAIQVVLRDVSERRKADTIVRGSEAKYRSLVENTSDGVYHTTPDGEILTANSSMARMLGYDSGTDLLLLNLENDIYIDSEERRQYLKLVNKGHAVKNAEFDLRGKDGQIVKVLENTRVVRNRLGDILYYEGTLTDVTELRAAQAALKLSEERSRALISKNTEPLWCFKLIEPMSTHISEERQIRHLMEFSSLIECNEAAARMYDLTHSKRLLGVKLKRLLGPSDLANIEYLTSFIRSKYMLINVEKNEVDRYGHSKYFLNNMTGVIEDGYLVRIWGTKQDITTERQTQNRLSESEEKFLNLTETASYAIFIFSDKKILYANPASEKISGYSLKKLLNMRFWKLIRPKYSNIIGGQTRNKPGVISPLLKNKAMIVTKSGEERRVDIAISSTTYNGKPAALAAVFEISEPIAIKKKN